MLDESPSSPSEQPLRAVMCERGQVRTRLRDLDAPVRHLEQLAVHADVDAPRAGRGHSVAHPLVRCEVVVGVKGEILHADGAKKRWAKKEKGRLRCKNGGARHT